MSEVLSKHSGSRLAQNALNRACLHCPCSWGQRPRSSARAQKGRDVEAGGGTRLRRCIKSSSSEAKGAPARRSRDARPQDHSIEFYWIPEPFSRELSLVNSPPQLRPEEPQSKQAPHNLQGAFTLCQEAQQRQNLLPNLQTFLHVRNISMANLPTCTKRLDRERSAHTFTDSPSKAVQVFLHPTGVRVPPS